MRQSATTHGREWDIVTEEQLKEFLRTSAGEAWEATAEPYLLSFVANDLKQQDQDYKSALAAEERLKGFAERVEKEEKLFKVVQHPFQKAKVGIIPFDMNYAFPVRERDSAKSDVRIARSRNEEALLTFFQTLKSLPDEMLDDVHIPTKVIAFLLRKK